MTNQKSRQLELPFDEKKAQKLKELGELYRLRKLAVEHGVPGETLKRIEGKRDELKKLRGIFEDAEKQQLDDAVLHIEGARLRGERLSGSEEANIQPYVRAAWDRKWIPRDVLEEFEKNPTPELAGAIRNIVDGRIILDGLKREDVLPLREKPTEEPPIRQEPPTISPEVQEALDFVGKGKFKTALEIAGKLLDTTEYESARRIYQEVLDKKPPDDVVISAWNGMGITYAREDNIDDALRCFDEALRINPRDVGVLSNKLIILSKQGKHEDVISCAEQALSVDPTNDSFGKICDRIASSYRALGGAGNNSKFDEEWKFRKAQAGKLGDAGLTEQVEKIEAEMSKIPPGKDPAIRGVVPPGQETVAIPDDFMTPLPTPKKVEGADECELPQGDIDRLGRMAGFVRNLVNENTQKMPGEEILPGVAIDGRKIVAYDDERVVYSQDECTVTPEGSEYQYSILNGGGIDKRRRRGDNEIVPWEGDEREQIESSLIELRDRHLNDRRQGSVIDYDFDFTLGDIGVRVDSLRMYIGDYYYGGDEIEVYHEGNYLPVRPLTTPAEREFARKYFGPIPESMDIDKLASAIDGVKGDDARRTRELLDEVLVERHINFVGRILGYNMTNIGGICYDLNKAYPSITDKGLTEDLLTAYLAEVYESSIQNNVFASI